MFIQPEPAFTTLRLVENLLWISLKGSNHLYFIELKLINSNRKHIVMYLSKLGHILRNLDQLLINNIDAFVPSFQSERRRTYVNETLARTEQMHFLGKTVCVKLKSFDVVEIRHF